MAAYHIAITFTCRFNRLHRCGHAVACAVAVSVLLLGTVRCADAQERVPFLPFDDAAEVPGLAATRTALIEAIVRRDARRIAALLAPDFNISEGGPESALKAFVESPSTWDDFVVALGGGGGFIDAERRTFCAPFWHVKSPFALQLPPSLWPDELHPFIVMLPHVPVFEARSLKSRVVGHVGLELVRLVIRGETPPGDADSGELAAISLDGRTVYIERSVLLDPDARHSFTCMEERDGKWLLSKFGYK